jgi:hypothetical protein
VDPRTFKCEAEGLSAIGIRWQTVPGKNGTDAAIDPDVGINGTSKGAIEDGKTHGGAEGIDHTKLRKCGRGAYDSLVNIKVSYNDPNSAYVSECFSAGACLSHFKYSFDLLNEGMTIIDAPG